MGLFTREIESMNDLFVHELQDIYYAEQQIVGALPQMISKATAPQLRTAFDSRRAITPPAARA